MKSLVMVVFEHGDDTDDVQSFVENLQYDIRFQYPALEIDDWSVKVDLPPCFSL